ncbi:MAG: hypothetical protein U5L96_02670 [Owenweeksia sp.]|nr:hypothetical protein [Owenweeksia sp.]
MKYLYLLMLLLLIACKSGQKTSDSEGSQATDTSQTAAAMDLAPLYCEEIIAIKEPLNPEIISSTKILHYELKQNCICLKYQYSGCREGAAILFWNGKWPSETQPKLMLHLRVLEAGLCEQLLTDSACFSTKNLKLVGNEIMVYLNSKENGMMLDLNSADQ